MYTRYPLKNILTYNGATVAHYTLGAAGIMLGYHAWPAYLLGGLYLLLSLAEMYLHMPLKVCPNCVYFSLKDSVCISGLNLLSRQIATAGDVKKFGDRAKGTLCPNNLYIAALVVPIVAIIPALVIDFSVPVLILLLLVIGLMLFRFFVIFTHIACVHCRAKNICPQAQQIFKD